MSENNWLLLTYKVPPDPASRRVALWRRLKGMGAVYLQNGVCLLPRNDDHVRRLKMLENEVRKMGGESVILETAALDQAQEEKVVARFKLDRDDEYREFIGRCDRFEEEIAKEFAIEKFTYAELEEEDADLKKLQSWFERIKKLDFYGGDLAAQAAEKLRACETVLEKYAQRVFEAQDEIMGKPAEAPESPPKTKPAKGAGS
jgi:Protein ChrB, N-terminal